MGGGRGASEYANRNHEACRKILCHVIRALCVRRIRTVKNSDRIPFPGVAGTLIPKPLTAVVGCDDVHDRARRNISGLPRRLHLLAKTVARECLPGFGNAGSALGRMKARHRTGFTRLSGSLKVASGMQHYARHSPGIAQEVGNGLAPIAPECLAPIMAAGFLVTPQRGHHRALARPAEIPQNLCMSLF